jgi:predicted signal transduction protein with EAL and GGDEF domain
MYSEETDNDNYHPAFRRMIAEIKAKNPGVGDIAMVFTLGENIEIVRLVEGPKAKAEIKKLRAGGAKCVGGFVYGSGLSVPFAVDTDASRPNFTLVDNLLRRMEKQAATEWN